MASCHFAFNAEIKEKIIKECVSDSYRVKVGNAISCMEMMYGKDVFELTVEEATAGIERAGIWEPIVIRMLLRALKQYIVLSDENEWCNKFDSGIFSLSDDAIPISKQIAKTFLLHPQELYDILSEKYEFETKGLKEGVSLNYIIPGLVLEWHGFSNPVGVLESEVDMGNHTVKGTHITDELWPLIQQYIENDIVRVSRADGLSEEFKKRDGTTLLKYSPRKGSVVEIDDTYYRNRIARKLKLVKFQKANISKASDFYRICHRPDFPNLSFDDYREELGIKDGQTNRTTQVNDNIRVIKAYSELSRNYKNSF